MNWIISDKDGNPILKVSQEEGNEIIRRGIEEYDWQKSQENCRHGYWIPMPVTDASDLNGEILNIYTSMCSECGRWAIQGIVRGLGVPSSLRYCPYCGAKMDKTGEE